LLQEFETLALKIVMYRFRHGLGAEGMSRYTKASSQHVNAGLPLR
jgi:hypothetical protein